MTRRKKNDPGRISWSPLAAQNFFRNSSILDHEVLRPLSHVAPNWELTFDRETGLYVEEEDSLAAHLNVLIDDMSNSQPRLDYHAAENELASGYLGHDPDDVYLDGKIWRDSTTHLAIDKDYVGHMIEQSTAGYYDVEVLVEAAAGRVATSLHFGISHFDSMDSGHMLMLSTIMTDILFRRSDRPAR